MSWRDTLTKTTPYVPGEQLNLKNLIKLNTNESPYPPSPRVVSAIKDFGDDFLRLYPNPDGEPLRSALANYYGVTPENIFLGNGSDEVIALAFMTYFKSGKPLLFPEITYSFYKVWADIFNIKYETVPLKKDFTIDPKEFFRENGGIIFPNPNAPTSIGLSENAIEEILKQNQNSVVIIDEAYADFMGHSALPLLNKYENLVVIKTFSKSRSLAAMRLGFAIGNTEVISALNGVKNCFNSYTINRVSVSAGCASIEDEEYFIRSVNKIISTRNRVSEKFLELGFNVLPSEANFIFVSHKEKKATDIAAYLRKNNILVRHFNQQGIDNYLRITIGNDKEMDKLLSVLKNYLTRSIS